MSKTIYFAICPHVCIHINAFIGPLSIVIHSLLRAASGNEDLSTMVRGRNILWSKTEIHKTKKGMERKNDGMKERWN